MPEYHDYYQVDPLGTSKYINILKVPNNWLKELFDIFETYNFTIDENTPVDVELSIEPEMLGRIFENLLAEINPETGNTARKSTGSYYTPRPIVEYMVDESLKQYLLIKTNLDENEIFSLLTYEEEETGLSESEKDTVIDALDVIKIIDPACGSGAFPMGILQKMLLILQKIDPESKKWLSKKVPRIENFIVRKELQKKIEAGNWNYIHKLGIIQNSIYGVDIQSIAVDISKLRFFLSLIVDEKVDDSKENRGVESLPNLEFKFVCANSLIGLPKKNSQTELFEVDENIRELKKLREEYFRSYGDEKILIENKFKSIQNKMFTSSLEWLKCSGGDSQTSKLSQWNPFSNEPCEWFDPDWMFGVRDGFDVVIANPPYIGEKSHKEMFREIKQGTLGKYYQGKMDLFYFFFHLALDIGKQNSQIAFITTNYYSTAYGAKKLRQEFKENTIISILINFNELKIFESALGQHNMITILKKAQDKDFVAKTCVTKQTGNAASTILENIVSWQDDKTDYFEVAQKDIYEGDECYIRHAGNSLISGDPVQLILEKIKKQGNPLGNMAFINQGVVSGCDYVSRKNINKLKKKLNIELNDGIYVFDLNNPRDVNIIKTFTDVENKLLRPFFKNSDIKRYWCKSKPSKLLLYSQKFENLPNSQFPNVIKHLNKFKDILEQRLLTYNENYYWSELHRSRSETIFIKEKITVPYRSETNTFAYNSREWFCRSDSYVITQKDKDISLRYLLPLLNSKLYYLWLYYRGKRKGETLELFQIPLAEIPIKNISEPDQNLFIEIVDKILSITESGDYLENPNTQAKFKEYEKQIDQLVYKLYGLTEDEIEIVENFHKKI